MECGVFDKIGVDNRDRSFLGIVGRINDCDTWRHTSQIQRLKQVGDTESQPDSTATVVY